VLAAVVALRAADILPGFDVTLPEGTAFMFAGFDVSVGHGRFLVMNWEPVF